MRGIFYLLIYGQVGLHLRHELETASLVQEPGPAFAFSERTKPKFRLQMLLTAYKSNIRLDKGRAT